MSSPMAAGVAALLLEENPDLTPQGLRRILTGTASNGGVFNVDEGFGLVDAHVGVLEAGVVWIDFAASGPENGTFERPHDSLGEGMADLPTVAAGSPVLPVLRIKSGSVQTQTILSKPMRIMSHGGSVTIGTD